MEKVKRDPIHDREILSRIKHTYGNQNFFDSQFFYFCSKSELLASQKWARVGFDLEIERAIKTTNCGRIGAQF